MMTPDIKQLLQRYTEGSATEEEKKVLTEWLATQPDNGVFQAFVNELLEGFPADVRSAGVDWDALYAGISERKGESVDGSSVPVRRMIWWRWAAAAVIILGIGLVLLLRGTRKPQEALAPSIAEVQPGRQGAILVLDNGKEVVLDSLAPGEVAKQQGARVVLGKGALQYESTVDSAANKAVVWNAVRTPRGRQFQVTLPDGTRVWLNAESEVRYPTAFVGKDRRVQMTGEVYFEVAANKSLPFIVEADGRAGIEVLGTSFNINAYANESTLDATLIEGAIRVVGSGGTGLAVLKPGQQAQVSNGIKVSNVTDPDKILAWKNGVFDCEGVGMAELMRQIERWYDVDVVYEKGIPDKHFIGEIPRSLPLTKFLRALGDVGVHFKVDGRRLIVQ